MDDVIKNKLRKRIYLPEKFQQAHSKERIETGALRINDDHMGLFIRGDDAIELEFILATIILGESLSPSDKVVLEKYYFEINRRVCCRG